MSKSSADGGVVFGAVAPHGWLAVPLLAGRDGARAQATQAGLAELGRRMEALQPATVVVVDPHGLAVEGAFTLLDAPRVTGSTGGPVDLGATRHGYSLDFAVDRDLVAAIAAAAGGVAVHRLRGALEFLPLDLEFGTMNPLWSLGAAFATPPAVVAAGIGAGLPRDACVAFGRAVRSAAAATGRRVAVVASADLAHTHAPDGPFGADDAAAACDAAVVEAVAAGDLARLLDLDAALVARSLTEAVEPLLVLHGALGSGPVRAEVIAYEVPTYFGMLCAEITPRHEPCG